ncbi:MAG: hypothetical protein IJ795_00150 [Bacteroidales bacterium]|nr:hypothetical protein [Bacteroidales bacterium]
MEKYRQDRERQRKVAGGTGILLTVGVHLVLALAGTFTGMKYLYPPPPEQTFLIDFTEPEARQPRQVRDGSQPRAEEIDRTRKLELVQRSEAQEQGKKANEAREATGDDFGDVEKYEPSREKEIDNRALFHAADNKTDKDTLAAQTASKVSEALQAGHASGNTSVGKQTGEPNAHLQGRKVEGVLPRPAGTTQDQGTVVVTIWVDQYGTVQRAEAGADGTTIVNKKVWAEARAAAMKAHFNMSAEAPALQKGFITYNYKLK